MVVVPMFLAAVAAFAVTNAIDYHWAIEVPIWFASFSVATRIMWWAFWKVFLSE